MYVFRSSSIYSTQWSDRISERKQGNIFSSFVPNKTREKLFLVWVQNIRCAIIGSLKHIKMFCILNGWGWEEREGKDGSNGKGNKEETLKPD